MRGRRILEVGCGGGQCSIAFAKQGAIAAGLDLSDAQLDHARSAAAAEGVEAGDACGEEATARQTLDLLHLRRQRGACLCDDAGRAHPPA